MSRILLGSYLIYELSITCLKLKKLYNNIHRKNADLNKIRNEILWFNLCTVLNLWVIFIKQKTKCPLLCVEYSSIAT